MTRCARRQSPPTRGTRSTGAVALTVALLSGCHDALANLAASPSTAEPSTAEQLFAALGARVNDPWRDPKYDAARVKIANSAFLPSRVWGDTSVWVAASASRRTLLISGHAGTGRYRLEAVPALPPVTQPADSRHVIHLTRLAEGEYSWDTDVFYAIGPLKAYDAGRLVGALLSAAEGRSEDRLRADYRATVPRASAALGQLFRVDSIATITHADRSTTATFAVTVTPEGLDATYPDFANYMRRYGESTRISFVVADRAGVPYLEFSLADGRIMLRTRTLAGVMLPLAPLSSSKPVSDSLSLTADLTLKVRHLTIGVRKLHGELTVIRTPHERAWNLVIRQEPDWVLPPVAERLLRTPLRRPFQGSGALYRVGVRDDSAGGQSLLHRRLHLEVQESLILRFIGKLGAKAAGDYSGRAEREQYAWLTEVFRGFVEDARALRAGPKNTKAAEPSVRGF